MDKIYISYQDESAKPAVREATPAEIASMQVTQSDWLHSYPLRIIAPKALALVYPQIYIWFQINDLPIEKVGDMMHLYCNEIMPEHQGLIDANSEIITVETKPANQ